MYRCTKKLSNRHTKDHEPTVCAYLGIMILCKTRKRDLHVVDTFFKLGLFVSYHRELEISTSMAYDRYVKDGIVCPTTKCIYFICCRQHWSQSKQYIVKRFIRWYRYIFIPTYFRRCSRRCLNISPIWTYVEMPVKESASFTRELFKSSTSCTKIQRTRYPISWRRTFNWYVLIPSCIKREIQMAEHLWIGFGAGKNFRYISIHGHWIVPCSGTIEIESLSTVPCFYRLWHSLSFFWER